MIARWTEVSLLGDPTGSGQINTALGSTPLWLLEILRNHVVDKGRHALIDRVRDAHLSAHPVLRQSWNVAMWLGGSTVRSVGLLRAKAVSVRQVIGLNETLEKAAFKELARTTLAVVGLDLPLTVVNVHSRALAETVDRNPVRIELPGATVTVLPGRLLLASHLDLPTTVRPGRSIAVLDLVRVVFKTVPTLAVPGVLVRHRMEIKNVPVRVAQQLDGLQGRANDSGANDLPLGERHVLQAVSVQPAVLIEWTVCRDPAGSVATTRPELNEVLAERRALGVR